MSWDATMLDVPDSAANRTAFITSRNTRGRGAFPKGRLLQLIECGTHAVIDAAFGAVSEQMLARRVLGSLGAGMLLLCDRNFPSDQLWRETTATGAHLLWRVKASTRLVADRKISSNGDRSGSRPISTSSLSRYSDTPPDG